MKEMIEKLKEIITQSDRVWLEQINETYYSDHLARIKVRPAAVVKVVSTEEVSAVLKFAYENSIPVIPRGANTGLTGATIPVEGSIVLDLTLLNHIIDLDKETFTLTVEAGVLLEELQQFVEGEGLFYPPDPGEKQATIGGNISTNAGGMRAVKFGVTRDYVRGLEVVLANGEILNLGANTIKNSSGLDIKDLIIGSEGTLAVVTKAYLKVIPKPKYSVSILASFEALDKGIDTVLQILGANVDATAIEFIEKRAVALSENYLGLKFPSQIGEAYLLFTLDGETQEEVERRADKIEVICKEKGALEVLLLEDEEAAQTTWKIRGAIVTAIEAKSQQEPIDIVVPINRSAEFVKFTKEVSRTYEIDIQNFGHAGDGNVHLCIIKGDLEENQWQERLEQVLYAIYKKASELKGLPSGEHGIGLTKKKYYLEYADEHEITLMRSIKAAVDPKHILNPNKVF